MLSPEDQFRARVAIGDPVSFCHRGRKLQGKLIRTNPKRAIVQTEENEFSVPYALLIPDPITAEKREQQIEMVLQEALGLMTSHGLKNWTFKLDHSARRAGCCNYRDRTISLSFNLAQSRSGEEITDTLLHEIAHALVGKQHNHDAAWKAKAREMGCSGERTHRMELAPPRWKVRCENGCWTHVAHRRNPRLICRKCKGKLIYTQHTP